MRTLRRVALASASAGFLLAAVGNALSKAQDPAPTTSTTTTSSTSAACTAFTGSSTLNSTFKGRLLPVTLTGLGPQKYNKGETVTVTLTSATSVSKWSLQDSTGNTFVENSGAPLSYTFTADTTVEFYIGATTTEENAGFTKSCIATASTDPDKAEALQAGVTKAAAATSASTVAGQVSSAISSAFSDTGGSTVTPSAGGVSINFTAEPQSIASRTDDAFSALAYAGNANKAPPRLALTSWSVWADVHGTSLDTRNNSLSGNQVNLTGGIGKKLTPDFLLGVLAGYEHMKYSSSSLGGDIKGDGGSVGVYMGWRLLPALRWDAFLAFGHVNYASSVGTLTGSFGGDRIVASTTLTGKVDMGAFRMEPSARIFALSERQQAWDNSLGTTQPSRKFSDGMVSLGDKVMRDWALANGIVVTPSAGFYGDWRFSQDDAIPVGQPVVGIGDGWTGRATAGLTFRNRGGGAVTLGAEYAGIGGNYSIWTGSVMASVPF